MPFGAAISIIGSICLLAAYIGLQLKVLKQDTYLYQILNIVGAAGLCYSVIKPFNSGVFITEFLWAIFGIVGLFKFYRMMQAKKAGKDIKKTQ